MDAWNWLLTVWRRFTTVLHVPTRNRSIVPSTSETSCELDLKKLRTKIDQVGVYDLHDILRQRNRVEWPEWHLNIGEHDKAIKIAENFHQDFKKLKPSSSIVDQIDTIKRTFLKFMPDDDTNWNEIKYYFKQAREEDNPILIMKAYTLNQCLTERLNKHSAVNTNHALKLYCTLLNCPILAQTQEYTEAFTSILFHPKLDEFLVNEKTVYRRTGLEDKLAAKYKKDATIITTTFLSTSMDPDVTVPYGADLPENMIPIFCTYNISRTSRRTALDLSKLSKFEDEKEILILRYVPFKIRSIGRMDDGRTMTICFDECEEHSTVEENRF